MRTAYIGAQSLSHTAVLRHMFMTNSCLGKQDMKHEVGPEEVAETGLFFNLQLTECSFIIDLNPGVLSLANCLGKLHAF